MEVNCEHHLISICSFMQIRMQEAWLTVPEALISFKDLLDKNCPRKHLINFRHKLNISLKNASFLNEMSECGALLNWDEDNKVFNHLWTEDTIKAAVKAIKNHYAKTNDNGSLTKQEAWSTVPEALISFKDLLKENCPRRNLINFRHKLNTSLNNASFRNSMIECGALLNWDEDNKVFDPPWTQATIEAAVKAIENSPISPKVKIVSTSLSRYSAPQPVAILRQSFLESTENKSSLYHKKAPKLLSKTGYQLDEEKPPVSPGFSPREQEILCGKKCVVPLNSDWYGLAGSSLELTDPSNFIKIADIIEQPKFTNKDVQLLRPLLPFILQKIKMWDCKVLRPEYLSQLAPITEDEPIWIDDDIDGGNAANERVRENGSNNWQVLNKFAILTFVVASTEVTILSDIFQNISKFPIALPLILPNPIPNKTGKMVMTTSVLDKCLIKWEQKGKQISESFLFRSPYMLITAIRIGNADSFGKSSFLNQIFLHSNTFQCKAQPGNGKPTGLNGSAEFIWLTKDTCKEIIWSTIQTEIEANLENEIVLLANVHGDALQNEDTLAAMTPITSKYIVFVMPDETTNKNKEKLAKICGKENLLFIYVDPKIAVDNLKTLRSHLIIDNNATLNKLKQYIKQAIKTGKPNTSEKTNCTSIAKIPPISTKESTNFMDLVHKINNSEGYIKDMLRLQKIKEADAEQYWSIYISSPYLLKLMEEFAKILYTPLSERRIGFSHVEHELSVLSAKKLAGFSSKLAGLLEKRNSLDDTDPLWEKTNEEIAIINKEFANSLSLNDILRELSIAYEIVSIHGNPESISLVSKLPALYAELLIEGRTLEILDGDSESVSGIWLDSVCHEICQKLGPLKVFVVSILGLQSSGKSTLLNALFGCKFATSVGKCTKGLYMRLMMLEKSFRKQLGLDAILVVDTEGLGSPEAMLDPNSESKDRTMATFAMTISNLTLINVAGESNKEMVDILQIVILTMARMEKTDLSPDLLLVQQVPEGGRDNLLAKGVDNFCRALEEAVKVIQSQEIDLGVRTLANLKTLKRSLRQREILYQLRPFKSGASPQSPPTEEYCQDVLGLRTRIFNEYSRKKQFIYFCTWHKLLQGYWQAVQKENFALRFTSMRQVQEFIEVNSRLAAVKNDLDMVFQYHREAVEDFMNKKLDLLKKETVATQLEKEIYEQINFEIDQLPGYCKSGESQCKWCLQAEVSRKALLEFVKQTSSVSVNDTEIHLNAFIDEIRITSKSQSLRRFESLKIKQGKASEFDKILNKIMRDPKKRGDIETVSVDDVWNELKSIVQKNWPIKFEEKKVIDHIIEDYRLIPDCKKWKQGLEQMINGANGPKPLLATERAKKKKRAIRLSKPNLDLMANEHNWLCGKLLEVTENVVNNRRKARAGYAQVLVTEHKKKVAVVLLKFDEVFKTSLENQFKHDAMFYSLQLFLEQILQLQADWDRQNEPFCILLKQKEEYIQKISMYLANQQSPLQIQNLGTSAAKKLLKVAQSVCIRSLEVANYFDKWATHAEGIRLRYLIALANELKQGNDEVVLEHFKDPQSMLSEWYLQTIEYALHDIIVPMLKETFMEECLAIGNQIVGTKTWNDLLTFINWYLQKDGESQKFEEVTESMQGKLKLEIQKQMSIFVKDYTEQFSVPKLPLKEETFLNILGCTATCPGCAAICWGTKNHENGLAKYRRHFTIHQPKGLAGVADVSGVLDYKSCCHNGDDNNNVDDGDKSGNEIVIDDMLWLNEIHPVEEYTQLMDWFFLKLRGKLSKKFGSAQPRNDAKEKAQLAHLEKQLDHILSVIKHKILH